MEGRSSDPHDVIHAQGSHMPMLSGENDVIESSSHKENVFENKKLALLEVTNIGDPVAPQNGFQDGKEIKNDLLEGTNKEQSSDHVHEDENCFGHCKGNALNKKSKSCSMEDEVNGQNGIMSVSGSESPMSDDLKILCDNVPENKIMVHSLHKEELNEVVGDNSVKEGNITSTEDIEASHTRKNSEAIADESFDVSEKRTDSVIKVEPWEDFTATTEEQSSKTRVMTSLAIDSRISHDLENEERRSTNDTTAISDTKEAKLAPEIEFATNVSDSHTKPFLVDTDIAWSNEFPDPRKGETVNDGNDNETFLIGSKSSYLQNDLFLMHEQSPLSITKSADGTIAAENISKEAADLTVEETAVSQGTDLQDSIVVSTDLEGWHRFDEQDSKVDGMIQREPQFWEQLLEDALETSEKPVQSMHISTLQGGNQSWLASPGNPFIEGLDRFSNFSEAEGFAVPSNDTFAAASLSAMDNENVVPGVYAHGQVDSNSYEAPSFMSIVDPKTNALFKSSMPSYQGANVSFSDTWEAKFDPVVPSKIENNGSLNAAQEISRSYSLSRATDNSNGQKLQEGHRWSFSAASQDGGSSKRSSIQENVSQSKASGFLSPKLSPLVKKVVQKVQHAPAVANQVLHSFHHSKSKETNQAAKKPGWTRFFCCSKSV